MKSCARCSYESPVTELLCLVCGGIEFGETKLERTTLIDLRRRIEESKEWSFKRTPRFSVPTNKVA